MAMQGPDFKKQQFVGPPPASNADVGRTIAYLMRNGALPEVASRVVPNATRNWRCKLE